MHNPILPLLIIATLPLAGQSAAIAMAPVAAPPAAGAAAPAFDTPDQDGIRHSLKAYAGRPVLLAFYPSDFTGG